ncbi:MAG: alpha/beta fold hydrolase [Pseudomonadota bacterium]
MHVSRIWAALGVAALASGIAPVAEAGCDGSPEPCVSESGLYHIELPETAEAAPVLVFLHGYRSHGGATIGNTRIVEPLLERGWAVIAPNAVPMQEGSPAGSWNFRSNPAGRDETAFLSEVVTTAADRFGTSPDKVVLGGFSAGGFMVSYLACAAPDTFPAYAPVSGGFWRPHPESCEGPVRLLHTHGWQDGTVPLEGRPLGGGRFRQGDIFAGLEIWRQANGCDMMRPDEIDLGAPFWRRVWTDCTEGSALEFALFPGGHTVPDGWADMMADWFEALPES